MFVFVRSFRFAYANDWIKNLLHIPMCFRSIIKSWNKKVKHFDECFESHRNSGRTNPSPISSLFGKEHLISWERKKREHNEQTSYSWKFTGWENFMYSNEPANTFFSANKSAWNGFFFVSIIFYKFQRFWAQKKIESTSKFSFKTFVLNTF